MVSTRLNYFEGAKIQLFLLQCSKTKKFSFQGRVTPSPSAHRYAPSYLSRYDKGWKISASLPTSI